MAFLFFKKLAFCRRLIRIGVQRFTLGRLILICLPPIYTYVGPQCSIAGGICVDKVCFVRETKYKSLFTSVFKVYNSEISVYDLRTNDVRRELYFPGVRSPSRHIRTSLK